MSPEGKLGNVRPTSASRLEMSAVTPMLRCFRFRNYLSEQWLFVAGSEAACASKFGVANHHFLGIVSVWFGTEREYRPRQDKGSNARFP